MSVIPHVRICAGGTRRRVSLVRLRVYAIGAVKVRFRHALSGL